MREIQAGIPLRGNAVNNAKTTCQSLEIAAEVLKTFRTIVRQGIAMQVAMVETESSTHGPFLKMAGDRGKGTDIKQAVGRDEEFFTEVLGVLPHTGDIRCPLPQLFVAV